MNPLQLFYRNESEREAVRAFLVETLRENAADKALKGEDTKGFQDAKDAIDNMFDKLQQAYDIIKKPTNNNSR